MPQLDGSQMRIGGEILDSDWDDPSTSTTQSLLSTFSRLGSAIGRSGLQTSFKSDRGGTVEIYVQAYINKTSDDGVGSVRIRLVNGINSEISGTDREVIAFQSGNERQLIGISWFMSVTDDTDYIIRPQIRKSTSTQDFDVRWGGNDPALSIKIIGL